MKLPIAKRSIVVAGRKTSVSLEEAFWNGMTAPKDRRSGSNASSKPG
jgi:predicted DNA-binding ribbon-helix-helix protein